jgi:general transcription factor 3C polypeptide 5 (transcription factor C subunit 1)
VPKRTGRKRKKGSNGPWQGNGKVSDVDPALAPPEEQVCSRSRLDDPRLLRSKLADNAGKYEVEAVGVIKQTHRFRALADFYWDMSNRSDFARNYATKVLPGDGERVPRPPMTIYTDCFAQSRRLRSLSSPLALTEVLTWTSSLLQS